MNYDFATCPFRLNLAGAERSLHLANGGGVTRVLPPSKAAMTFDDELARQWAREHARNRFETKGTAT